MNQQHVFQSNSSQTLVQPTPTIINKTSSTTITTTNTTSLNSTNNNNNNNNLDISEKINDIYIKNDEGYMKLLFENDKFTFYNSNGSILGSFTFKQIIKYIGKQIDKQFYSNIDSGVSEELIKMMITDITIDPVTGKLAIILRSHLESPFMGNLDLLIKLNNMLFTYEKTNLLNDLTLIRDEKLQYKLKQSIKQFIYLLLNHTLKIISIATENASVEMKNKLLKYSVALTYRISNFMKEHIDSYNNQYKILYGQLEKLVNIKNIMNKKLEKLEDKIEKQNNLIFSILNKKEENTSFEELFEDEEDDINKKNNYYESDVIKCSENYLLTEETDISLIL
jgi:hypothetical protein